MMNPLQNKAFRISSAYGMRYLSGVYGMHYGTDLVCLDGTQGANLVAVVDGTVTDMRTTVPDSHTGLGITLQVVGNYVYITAPDGHQALYRHLRHNSTPAGLKVGSKVRAGDVIGRMGRTGQATPTADHLHFEARDPSGVAFDLGPYLMDAGKPFPAGAANAAPQTGNAAPQTGNATPLAAGDKVKVLSAVNYDTGGPFKTYYDKYDVIQAKGERVVIGVGNVVTAAVSAKHLQKV
jgi:murein DD-endopeptidase MepM/ murein hydrolase activator NlpD